MNSYLISFHSDSKLFYCGLCGKCFNREETVVNTLTGVLIKM